MRKKRKSGLFILLLLIVVAMFAYFTNPMQEMHKEATGERINMVFEKTLDKYGLSNSVLGALGSDIAELFVAVFVEKHVSSKDYFLFSTTQINLDNKSQIIGIGAFNKVFISGKVDEALEREIDKYIEEKIKKLRIPFIDLNSLQLDF